MRDLVADSLATYRLTRLIVEDDITAPLRARVKHMAMREIDSPGVASKVDTLLSCPWCVGMWVSFGVVAARRLTPAVWSPVATALAFSAVTGVIAENA